MTPPDPNDLFNDIPDPLGAANAPPVPSMEFERSVTRSRRRRRLTIAAAVTGIWSVGFSLILGLRADIKKPVIAGQMIAWAVATVAALWVGSVTRVEGFPPSKRLIGAALLAVSAVFWGLALLQSPGVEAALSLQSIVGCAMTGLVAAAPPSLAFAVVLHRGFLTNSTLHGALVGAACGLLGAVGVHSHCPVVTPSHVAVAHGIVLVFGAIAGAALGRWLGRA